MTTRTPSVEVLEIDGVWFRNQKLRGRRSTRMAASLAKLFGGGAPKVLAGTEFAELEGDEKVEFFVKLLATAPFVGGKAMDPDVFESSAAEILHYTAASGGQGWSYSPVQLDASAQGWTGLAGLDSLDAFDGVDYKTYHALLYHSLVMNMRPTSAGTTTSGDTVPAATTSAEGSAQPGATSGPQIY